MGDKRMSSEVRQVGEMQVDRKERNTCRKDFFGRGTPIARRELLREFCVEQLCLAMICAGIAATDAPVTG